MARSRASTFLEVGNGVDPAQVAATIAAAQEENLWAEQRTLHACLTGEWVFKGAFGKNGQVVKVPKDVRQTFEITMHNNVSEYQKKERI